VSPKDYLTNKAFCPIPWTGLMYNFDGSVKNCIRSQTTIGNLKDNSITEILEEDIAVKLSMRDGKKFDRCTPCYDLEENTNKFAIISDRVFYLKELRHVDSNLYDTKNFSLNTVDLRWSNLCNFSCVYCNPEFSSKWASELKVEIKTPNETARKDFKNWIFGQAAKLKHVYLAGGEPLLMKENLEFLEILKQENPNVNLRINTNLSKTDTEIFKTICNFKNVHWTVSIESMEEEFEYIRYGSNWVDFQNNLHIIKSLDHKITFNMLHFILNATSIFGCVDWLISQGFHANSFVIGSLLGPDHLNIRHLPDSVLECVKNELQNRINDRPGYLLENSYKNLLQYIQSPIQKNYSNCLKKLRELDQRRGCDSTLVFPHLYTFIKAKKHDQTI